MKIKPAKALMKEQKEQLEKKKGDHENWPNNGTKERFTMINIITALNV